jgi:hypothetical protein
LMSPAPGPAPWPLPLTPHPFTPAQFLLPDRQQENVRFDTVFFS